MRPFFSRVPTHSNFGDAPSRGRFEDLLKLGAQQAHVSDDMIYALSKSPECGEFPLEMRDGAMGKREHVTFPIFCRKRVCFVEHFSLESCCALNLLSMPNVYIYICIYIYTLCIIYIVARL